jgi:hypothetical protein
VEGGAASSADPNDPSCTLAGTAEHDRADGGEACDDGRAGK